jgi:hypothetical protein
LKAVVEAQGHMEPERLSKIDLTDLGQTNLSSSGNHKSHTLEIDRSEIRTAQVDHVHNEPIAP